MRKEDNSQIHKFIISVFKDIALCLGGIFLLHQVDDELIWTIAASLEEIYESSLDSLKKLNSDSKSRQENTKNLRPHPAIEKFLLRLEKEK